MGAAMSLDVPRCLLKPVTLCLTWHERLFC